MSIAEPLSHRTTLRVGGRPKRYQSFDDDRDLARAIWDADQSGEPLLVLGGGSNLVVGDEPFPGPVFVDRRESIETVEESMCAGAILTVAAGTRWDALVQESIDQGFYGLEALSGIPGTVGAAPVQNIGAYGREVAENLSSVRAIDRTTGQVRTLPKAALRLGYRDSILKQSLSDPEAGGGRVWGPTGRWVVVEVQLQVQQGGMSAPVRYHELARRLGIEVGQRAPARDVRDAVLELRRSKGMVLEADDHDTWSAGSFFTNPILTETQAEELLPQDAPRFPVENGATASLATPNRPAAMVPGVVKTSAAWLIDHAGFHRGWSLNPGARAALSSKHVLAITNRGGATSGDVVELARAVHDGVLGRFGISLVPEPVFVGAHL